MESYLQKADLIASRGAQSIRKAALRSERLQHGHKFKAQHLEKKRLAQAKTGDALVEQEQ